MNDRAPFGLLERRFKRPASPHFFLRFRLRQRRRGGLDPRAGSDSRSAPPELFLSGRNSTCVNRSVAS